MSGVDPERLARLTLARAERVGPVAFRQLIRRFGSGVEALKALPDLARKAGAAAYRLPDPARIQDEITRGQALNAHLLLLGDPDFPPMLAAVDPPPPILWALGDPTHLSSRAVAVVGARVASAAGQRFARQLSADLAQAGLMVVSGMARGIDGAAHEGALGAGRATVAVLAGGVDDVYPPEHRDLYGRIAQQGCILSESPPGARAQARDFPRRNRIISGLSRAVVVVEAELRSGSLITARLAAEQGREVLAVPGSPLDPRARGVNDLIRQGATLCEGADDVLNVLSGLRALPAASVIEDEGADFEADEALREQVAALLSPTAVARDEIVRALGAPSAAVLAALVELSLAGRAQLLPGGMVSAIE
ncbi:DNA-processing protein DprA [Brevundimonas sp. 2R-24]|uniref:DNA-processing protein DprA n=1 Tax=Peiella sedimenti TaxID=3061083 RepID=A0ABT8SP47_9CAUL|nr:DNA-processing protein DprA [Caulobacteraceae bacterium XZ-24]